MADYLAFFSFYFGHSMALVFLSVGLCSLLLHRHVTPTAARSPLHWVGHLACVPPARVYLSLRAGAITSFPVQSLRQCYRGKMHVRVSVCSYLSIQFV